MEQQDADGDDSLEEKTRVLRDEADRLEEQAKRCRETADELEEELKARKRKRVQYESLYQSLLANDSSIQKVSTYEIRHDIRNGHSHRLWEALRHNTHVSVLNIHMHDLIDRGDKSSMPEGYSFEFPSVGNCVIEDFFQPLLQCIRTRMSLREVCLFGTPDDRSFHEATVSEILASCGENCNIASIQLWCKVPPTAFQKLMKSTTVHTLDLFRVQDWRSSQAVFYTPAEINAIANTFLHMSSLKSLDMLAVDVTLTTAILESLSAGRCELKELVLNGLRDASPDFWSGLSSLLHSTKCIKHLYLGDVDFDRGHMTGLMECFTCPKESTTSVLISKLTFTDCLFDSDAEHILLDFMQTKTKSLNHNGSESAVSLLRELAFFSEGDAMDLPSGLYKMLRASRDTGKTQGASSGKRMWCPTIGSEIHTLTMSNMLHNELWDGLTRKPHYILLKALDVFLLRRHDITGLVDFIAKTGSLRELRVRTARHWAQPIIQSLKENGTLQTVQIREDENPIADVATMRLIQAYGDRNQNLNGLLSSELEAINTAASAASEGLLYPTLLQASIQIPRTSASTLFSGMLILDESIGPRG